MLLCLRYGSAFSHGELRAKTEPNGFTQPCFHTNVFIICFLSIHTYYIHQALTSIKCGKLCCICWSLYPTAIGPGEIAGIIVGGLALVILLLVLAFLIRKRTKRWVTRW